MRKQIKSQIYRMLIVVGLIVGLTAWQFDFVWEGVNSNIYLNMTIIGTFLFGAVLAFRVVFMLGNEVRAYDSLKEAYDDIQQDREKGAEDPYWRHYRCLQPAVIVERPRILGHIYDLVYEELMRTRRLQISVSTLQNLIDGIDTRLSDDRSLLQYVTGLLVFLGLIGTFIGLMNMVGSVGGIIGGLDTTGSNSDAFSKLISDLKGPLVGMATGFSSSLFGLFTSLTLGLMGRFSSQAANTLKIHFEAWLANVSQIETADNEDPVMLGVRGPVDTEGLRKLSGAVASVTASFKELREHFGITAEGITSLAKTQVRQTGYLQRTARHLQSIADEQVNMDRKLSATLERMTDALAKIEERGREQADAMMESNAKLAERLEAAFEQFAEILKQDEADEDDRDDGDEAAGNAGGHAATASNPPDGIERRRPGSPMRATSAGEEPAPDDERDDDAALAATGTDDMPIPPAGADMAPMHTDAADIDRGYEMAMRRLRAYRKELGADEQNGGDRS